MSQTIVDFYEINKSWVLKHWHHRIIFFCWLSNLLIDSRDLKCSIGFISNAFSDHLFANVWIMVISVQWTWVRGSFGREKRITQIIGFHLKPEKLKLLLNSKANFIKSCKNKKDSLFVFLFYFLTNRKLFATHPWLTSGSQTWKLWAYGSDTRTEMPVKPKGSPLYNNGFSLNKPQFNLRYFPAVSS